MSTPPVFDIDPQAFWHDPYPALADIRRNAPTCFVPQLNAILMTKRDDIAECEKIISVFSSQQPDGLMTKLMGANMMRKDGEPHQTERRQAFPAFSPRTVRDTWKKLFVEETERVLDSLEDRQEIDLVTDYAMPVSGHALRHITGLTNLNVSEMDSASQGMIDGVGNYQGDPDIEARCHRATASIDAAIDARIPALRDAPDTSLLSVLLEAGQKEASIRANVKLAISGGQNEPRDAIAGAVWALLTHRDQLERVLSGDHSWLNVFEEYARWISPIGMSPRELAQDYQHDGLQLPRGSRVFFMFSSGNRDEDHFSKPDRYDVSRDTGKAVSFGAGPHFCAGAAASRSLIAEVALPMLFERFPDMELAGDAPFGGWAFRGPLSVPVRLNAS